MVRLAAALLLHLLPRGVIERLLRSAVGCKGYCFQPRFSGRVALFELAVLFRRQAKGAVALVPDYVCNIVPKAMSMAGWTVETYTTDERLEADWSQIVGRIAAGDVGVVVGASVFGSSGLLNDLSNSDKLDFLRLHGVKVIVDIAQDIRLARLLPANAGDLIAAVVSFNNKSFPGYMGGGILTSDPLPAPALRVARPDLRLLYRSAAIAAMRPLIWSLRPHPPSAVSRFNYSLCRSFPFIIEHAYRPAKLQLAFGLLGMWSLRHYETNKVDLLESGVHRPTRYADSAAYLMLESSTLPAADILKTRRVKSPYALEGQPEKCLRPDDVILYNRGFADKAG